VATASLELGIDIGDVDLVIQVGATRSIATFLQRVGRSGHALRKTPKGRLFPLTLDELVEAAALLRGVGKGRPRPYAGGAGRAGHPGPAGRGRVRAAGMAREPAPRDGAARPGPIATLLKKTWTRSSASTARDGARSSTEMAWADGCSRPSVPAWPRCSPAAPSPTPRTTRSARSRKGRWWGTVNEDWAIESNGGDIFQLGNTSWRILRVETGVVRVADAKGQPRPCPFWLGEAPGRTRELAAEIATLREEAGNVDAPARFLQEACGPALPEGAALQVAEYVDAGRRSLGTVPTQQRVVLERFFDESGGMQLVVHAPFGSKINRAWGLALRKKFCVGFGFELQAAANEEAIVLSLGPQHSFELGEVFEYLQPATARDTLIQALLPAPMFETRWRWNAQRSLMLERSRNGKKVPAALLRMRADDLLAGAFPQVLACPETLPGGPIEVPMEHPIVRQTVEDCLTEAMDVDGFLEVLEALHDGRIERRAVDTVEPSAFARGDPVLAAVHVPRRRAPRRAAAPRPSCRGAPWTRAARTPSAPSTRTPSRASRKRPGRSPPAPRKCTRRSSGWGT
jgi:ATP-dependent Lhr-like helicase